MESVLNKENQIHYVSEYDMIKFISINMPMDKNHCCDFVRDNDISSNDGGRVYWIKSELESENVKYYNPIAVKWILAFFEAHPWIERMMLVFDN